MGKKKKRASDRDEYEALEQDLKKAEASGNHKEAANIQNQLGHIARRKGDFEAAIVHHRAEGSLTRNHSPGDKIGLAVAYRNLGETYLEMSQEDSATTYFERYLQLAEEAKDIPEQQRAHVTIGRLALSVAEKMADEDDAYSAEANDRRSLELRKAEREFLTALRIAQGDGIKTGLSDKEIGNMKCGTLHNLGLVYEFQNKLDDAQRYLEQAITIGKLYGFYDCLVRSYTSLFTVHIKQKQYKLAYEKAKLVVRSAKQLKDKTAECESAVLEAKALFLCSDVESGLKVLKRVRKRIKNDVSLEEFPLEETEHLMQAAVRIIRNEDEKVKQRCKNEKLKCLNEKLGDDYVTLGNFSEALTSYKESTQNALSCGMRGKPLAELYYSVAQTLRDMGNFVEALEYHKKELEAYSGNLKEEFRTQMQIADCMEKLKSSSVTVAEEYKKALTLAGENPKNKYAALKALSSFFKKMGRRDQADMYEAEAQSTGFREPDEDSQDLLSEDTDFIDLDDLSEASSESEEEDISEEAKSIMYGKKKKQRMNEKGETALHIAAQKGALKKVKKLIAEGHNVNARDFAGWQPLHEACNFGFVDVVEELLKHKAAVDDTGGSGAGCKGITPLHDAASNGHFAVMEVLLKYNASVTLKDGQGNYPVDVLIGWYSREESITDEQRNMFEAMKSKLVARMLQKGISYTKRQELRARTTACQRSQSPEFCLMKSAMGDEVPVRIGVVDPDENEGRAGVREYDETMKGLRRKKSKPEVQIRKKRKSTEALLPQSQVVTDWLVADENLIEGNTSKRKRDPFDDIHLAENKSRNLGRARNSVATADVAHGGRSPSGSSMQEQNFILEANSELDEFLENNGPCSPNSPLQGSPAQNEVITIADSDNDICMNPASDPEPNLSSSSSTRTTNGLLSKKKQTTLPFKNVIIRVPSFSGSETLTNVEPLERTAHPKSLEVLRLKVDIEGNRKLIPVPVSQLDNTIGWLCEHISERYRREGGSGGVELKISLQTRDGAMLSEQDQIQHAIGDNETELVAIVKTTDNILFNKRFEECCQAKGVVPSASLKAAIIASETTQTLVLDDFSLRGQISEALASCMKHCKFLRVISLSGCSLRDSGISKLCEAISTIPLLEKLDLSCNGMTKDGLSGLVSVFQLNSGSGQGASGSDPPKNLKELNLSHNPLGDCITEELLALLRSLKRLKQLKLIDCNLTASLFSTNRRSLVSEINGMLRSNLDRLDVSFNRFGSGGMVPLKTEIDTNRLECRCCE